ncbi:DUF560 domain-containing protein [Salmonella enterica subsp. diarizonae]|nr:DUF560 domain-containing protein [Salmonella enterica subsp. diarizonae]ECQ1027589.1 DUF560 domain-containing protein [Salmonella enterica subsp. diarizonae]EDE1925952.1 DUF560 domain-containing protein [Salmonella enterica subsp. diarizonae]
MMFLVNEYYKWFCYMKLILSLVRIICFTLVVVSMQAIGTTNAEWKKADEPLIELSSTDLERYPYIAYQGLLQSLIQQNIQAIDIFLPAYQKLTVADPAFIRWANAIQASYAGKYREAIRLYRLLIADFPDNDIIRFQLAVTLFDNQDNEAAEKQFQKLRSGKLTQELELVLDSYLMRIQQRDFWSFNVQLSYANENNINNAPPVGTVLNGWQTARPESATGFDYGLSAEKSWSLPHSIFTEYRFDGYGNQYWDNHKYDQLTVRNSFGLGYRNKDIRFLMLPFYEQRWYGGGSGELGGLRYYANSYGLRGESRFQLTGNWQLYTTGEYGINSYLARKYLNGDEYRFSAMVIFSPSPEQYWFYRASYDQSDSRAADDSYYRYGSRAGWGYEWPYGISSVLQFSYGRKLYHGRDFFGIIQKNHEYASSITLWHRSIYFFGVTPKISWLYQKTNSNHPFYDFSKNKVLINFTKEF